MHSVRRHAALGVCAALAAGLLALVAPTVAGTSASAASAASVKGEACKQRSVGACRAAAARKCRVTTVKKLRQRGAAVNRRKVARTCTARAKRHCSKKSVRKTRAAKCSSRRGTLRSAMPAVSGSVPGPQNTGVPAGTRLKVHRGDLRIKTDNAVVSGLDVRGFINVDADNVTIKNTIVRGRAPGTINSALITATGQKGLLVQNVSVVAANASPYLDGIKGRNFTVDRTEIANVVDTMVIFGGTDTRVQNSWLHSNTHFNPDPIQRDGKSHDDNIQIEGGAGISILNNRIEGAVNAAIMITQNHSRSSDITIARNRIQGGGCAVNLAEKGKGPIANTAVELNVFGPSRVNNCAVIAPTTSTPRMSGNTWASDGTAVSARRG